MAEEALTAERLEEIGGRALTFQRYIYRRTWGTYYAIWAAAFAIFAYLNQAPIWSLVPQSLTWVPYVLAYGGTGWGAGIATAWIFTRAYRTVSLRRAINPLSQTRSQRRWALMWVWWAAFYVIAFVSFAFFQSQAFTVLFALLFSVEIFIYSTLRLSFPDGIPFEGKLALATYGACVVGSFTASFFTSAFGFFGIAWGATCIIWLFCALYALNHAPEELVELHLY